eukprot:7369728-Alexandrium_andersonii.AAC.1
MAATPGAVAAVQLLERHGGASVARPPLTLRRCRASALGPGRPRCGGGQDCRITPPSASARPGARVAEPG